MRDDFNKLVKDIIAKRVGLHCSNPICRKLTIGPNSDDQKTTNIGVAAHITAASPNGPRYNPLLTQEERSSIANAIWLCQSCAKLIDSDPEKYTVELISEWKSDAEKEAELELMQLKKIQPSKNYDDIFKFMTTLINEIIDDLKDYPLLRELILLKRGWVYNNSDKKKLLVYYYNDHEDLDNKITLLENNDLVRDITYNNTKRYLLTEEFVEILKYHDKIKI